MAPLAGTNICAAAFPVVGPLIRHAACQSLIGKEMIQTTFVNGNPWAGLSVPNTPRNAKEKPLAPRLPKARVPVEKQAKGEKVGTSVIPLSVAHALIEDLREYMRVKEQYEKLRPAVLARKYGLNENTVANIVYGESWSHISGFPRRVRKSKAKKES